MLNSNRKYLFCIIFIVNLYGAEKIHQKDAWSKWILSVLSRPLEAEEEYEVLKITLELQYTDFKLKSNRIDLLSDSWRKGTQEVLVGFLTGNTFLTEAIALSQQNDHRGKRRRF